MRALKNKKKCLLAFFFAAVLSVLCTLSPAYADETQVDISADGKAAKIEGYPFALDEFSRAQVGSNRPINDRYYGYIYYSSNEAGNVAVVVGDDCAVVYIPSSAADTFKIDVEDEAIQESLKWLLIALDNQAAQGSAELSSAEKWYFTSENEYAIDDLRFAFDQELKDDQFYACVIGEDGSDPTDRENPYYTELKFADFGKLVWAEDTELVVASEGWDAFTEFLSEIDYGPLWVTLKTTGTAIIFIFILGLAAAYFSLRIPPRAQDVADSIFTIPMVLPPTVCGFLLLLAFGRNTALGQWFIDIGFPLVFSWQATVLAAIVVAFPLMYRSARGAFENLDPNMLDAARTLGWSNAKIFFKLMLPLSWSSIAAGTVLAFARALGEFGATLFLAGNYAGITRTIPIAIYFEWMNGNTDVAIFWTIIIIIISFIVILFINLWSRRTTKYRRRAED